MEQSCVIVILAYFTGFQPKANTKNSLKRKIPLFSYKQNGVILKFSIFITSPVQRCREQKRRRNAQSGQQHFLCNVRQTNQGSS